MLPIPQKWKVAFAALGVTAIALGLIGAHDVPDTSGYTGGAMVRPPLVFYTWKACALFGARLQSHAFALLQAALGALAAVRLAKSIVGLSGCAENADVALTGLLFLPQLQAAATVASESLAYTSVCAFLAALGALGQGPICFRRTVAVVLFAGLSCEARPQFLYLIPLALLVCIVCVARAKPLHQKLRITAGLFGVGLSLLALHASYTIPRTGRLIGVPSGGLQLVTVVSHIANDADVERMSPGTARDFARGLRARIRALGLGADAPRRVVSSWQFGVAYNVLIGQVLKEFNQEVTHKPVRAPHPSSADYSIASRSEAPRCNGDLYCPAIERLSPLSALAPQFSPANWIALDDLTMAVSRELLGVIRLRYAVFVLRAIYEQCHYWLLLALCVFALGTALLASRRPTPHVRRVGLMLAFSGGLWLTNAGLVAAVEVVQQRYTFYLDSVLLSAVVAVLLRGLKSDACAAS